MASVMIHTMFVFSRSFVFAESIALDQQVHFIISIRQN